VLGLEKNKTLLLGRRKRTILIMKQNSKSLIIYNFNYTVYVEYPSIKKASKSLNCNEKTIITFAFE